MLWQKLDRSFTEWFHLVAGFVGQNSYCLDWYKPLSYFNCADLAKTPHHQQGFTWRQYRGAQKPVSFLLLLYFIIHRCVCTKWWIEVTYTGRYTAPFIAAATTTSITCDLHKENEMRPPTARYEKWGIRNEVSAPHWKPAQTAAFLPFQGLHSATTNISLNNYDILSSYLPFKQEVPQASQTTEHLISCDIHSMKWCLSHVDATGWHSLWVTLPLGVILTCIVGYLNWQIFHWLLVTPEVLHLSQHYLNDGIDPTTCSAILSVMLGCSADPCLTSFMGSAGWMTYW